MEVNNKTYIEMVEKAIKSFSKEIKLINYYKNFKVRNFRKNLDDKISLDGKAWSNSKTRYKDILSNKEYQSLELNLDNNDVIKYLKLQHNSELRFLLVEAYELFQKFIDEIYAILGLYDKTIWSKKRKDSKKIYDDDYTSIDEIKKLIKKDGYRNIKTYQQLIDLRNFLDDLYLYEIKDSDYFFTIVLISYLRHNIVHNQGYIQRNKLKEKIYSELEKREAELNNKSVGYNYMERDDEFISRINSFFGNGEYENMICITNIPIESKSYEDRFKDILIYDLISYAVLISKLVIKKFE